MAQSWRWRFPGLLKNGVFVSSGEGGWGMCVFGLDRMFSRIDCGLGISLLSLLSLISDDNCLAFCSC